MRAGVRVRVKDGGECGDEGGMAMGVRVRVMVGEGESKGGGEV